MGFETGGPSWRPQVSKSNFHHNGGGSGAPSYQRKGGEEEHKAEETSDIVSFVKEEDYENINVGNESFFTLIKDFFVLIFSNILKVFGIKPDSKNNGDTFFNK